MVKKNQDKGPTNIFTQINGGMDKSNKSKPKDNVKDTDSGEIEKTYRPKKNKSSKKNTKQNKEPSTKVKIDTNQIFDQVFGNVRLSVRAVARLHAYQTLNKLANRSEALNQIFDKFLPKAFNNNQKKHARNIESLFEEKYKDNSKQYERAVKRLKKQSLKESFKKRLNQNK